MKINFIIPNISLKPVGGYKVMYQYANAFAENGHDVYLYHVATIENVSYNIPHWLRWLRTKILYGDSKPSWFRIDDRIKTINIPFIKDCNIRKADFNFITMWAEVLEIAKLGGSIGKCVNFIQGYETWMGEKELIHKSFNTNAFNVVISKYLKSIVSEHTLAEVPVLPNPISECFREIVPMKQRKPASVSMLYSVYKYKGIGYGIEALKLVKERVPELTVEMFGIFKRPDHLPDWVHYHCEPEDLCGLYNSVSIHVSSSVNDGWDLPCTEAMKCGCALVCTDIAGHTEYAKEKDTALLAKAESSECLAQRIEEAIRNDELREYISNRGKKEVEKYTIQNSYKQLMKIISAI